MGARRALENGAARPFGGWGIAEHAVAHALGERFEHRRWRAEVGVGDPQRDDVAPGVTVPAQAPAARALHRRIEIYFVAVDCSSSSCGGAWEGSSPSRLALSST